MPKVFISYRREDSADISGRIYDYLTRYFGGENVFKDVDSIPLGADFRQMIETQLPQCDYVLAIIGNAWATAVNAQGQRRLDEPEDFVRIELEIALKHAIPIIPMLVSGASMPSAQSLPPSLAQLPYRNAVAIRPDPDFRHDMDRVIHAIATSATGRAVPPQQNIAPSAASPYGPAAQPYSAMNSPYGPVPPAQPYGPTAPSARVNVEVGNFQYHTTASYGPAIPPANSTSTASAPGTPGTSPLPQSSQGIKPEQRPSGTPGTGTPKRARGLRGLILLVSALLVVVLISGLLILQNQQQNGTGNRGNRGNTNTGTSGITSTNTTGNAQPTNTFTNNLTPLPTATVPYDSLTPYQSGVFSPNWRLDCGGCDEPLLVTITRVSVDTTNDNMTWTFHLYNHTGSNCADVEFYNNIPTLQAPDGNSFTATGPTYLASSIPAGQSADATQIFGFVPRHGASYTFSAQLNMSYCGGTDYTQYGPQTITFP
jgi:hypothetical protein